MSAAIEQRNQEATVYVGNLDEKVYEELLWELFIQVGPVVNVHMPKDKVTNVHQGYGFVEFRSDVDATYATKVLNMVGLYGKSIKVKHASQDKKSLDIGANLFIGGLDEAVDEKLLYDTFSSFGMIVSAPKVMRDPDTGVPKGYGFVSYNSFQASDHAIACMDGQHLLNKQVSVQYAYKKDSKGERHGSEAERLLAQDMMLKGTAPMQAFVFPQQQQQFGQPPPRFAPPPPQMLAPPPQLAPPPPQLAPPPPQLAPAPQPPLLQPPHMQQRPPPGGFMPPPPNNQQMPPHQQPPPHMQPPPPHPQQMQVPPPPPQHNMQAPPPPRMHPPPPHNMQQPPRMQPPNMQQPPRMPPPNMQQPPPPRMNAPPFGQHPGPPPPPNQGFVPPPPPPPQ